MKSTYTEKPAEISVYSHSLGTDIFLRKNITERTDEETGQTLFECDEVQGRVKYPVNEEEVRESFEEWWKVLEEGDAPAPERDTLEKLRADIDYIAIMTGVELEG